MGRACSRGLRQPTFLLILFLLDSVASTTGHSPDHIKLHLYEVPAPYTWPVTLQCDVEQPSASVTPCSGPYWSQQDSHLGHVPNDTQPVHDVKGISTSDVIKTSHLQKEISMGDNVTYQVQTNSLRITSRLRIQLTEPHRERYVCSVVCGLDTYIVSCTVRAYSQNNHTVLCSQEKFLAPDFGNTDSEGPGDTTQRSSDRPTTLLSTTKRLSVLDDEEKTGPSVVTIVWFTLAIIFFISFLMVIRWSLKHGQTLKELNRRYFSHLMRFFGLRRTNDDQTSDVHLPRSEQPRNQRSYVVHPVTSSSFQEETNDESNVLLEGYMSEVTAVSRNSRNPAASRWALRHVYASRDASSMVRCSEWSRQTPTRSQTMGGGAQASVVDVVVSFDELVAPSRPLLLRQAVSDAVPRGHGDVIVQELCNGDRLIYIPAVSLPSYDDVMTESRREAREGLSSLTDAPSHPISSARRPESSSSSMSSTSSLSAGESFEFVQRLDPREPSAFLQRPLAFCSLGLPPPPYMVRDTGREALTSWVNLQTSGSEEASVVSGNCRDMSRPPSYVSLLDVEAACTISAAVPTVERSGS